ncbi:MAG: hypothetical protein ACP5N7_04875 [Candidatus Pacearchaeota archaeon]
MRVKFIFLFLFLFFTTLLFSQITSVLECKYKISVSDKDGINTTMRTYFITNDKIFSFIENDSSRATLADFINQTVKIKSVNGTIHLFNMSDSRNPMNVKSAIDSINGFFGDILITNITGDEKISLTLDSSTKIPKFKGDGFFDVLDNGLGFLSIKGVKQAISPVEGQGSITWTISLISKKVTEVDINMLRVD